MKILPVASANLRTTHRDLNNLAQLDLHARKIRPITSDARVSERDEISRRGESLVRRRH